MREREKEKEREKERGTKGQREGGSEEEEEGGPESSSSSILNETRAEEARAKEAEGGLEALWFPYFKCNKGQGAPFFISLLQNEVGMCR